MERRTWNLFESCQGVSPDLFADEFEDLIANTLKELGIRVIGDTCGTRTQSGFELPAF